MEQISASWEFIPNLLQKRSMGNFWWVNAFQINLSLWKMQVIRYFLCVRHIGEKSLNRLLDCFYLKKQPLEVFCKKRCPEKFRKFYRKTPALESVFNKVPDLRTCNFLKKRLQHRFFPVNFAKHLWKKYLWTSASVPSQVLFTMQEKDTANAA